MALYPTEDDIYARTPSVPSLSPLTEGAGLSTIAPMLAGMQGGGPGDAEKTALAGKEPKGAKRRKLNTVEQLSALLLVAGAMRGGKPQPIHHLASAVLNAGARERQKEQAQSEKESEDYQTRSYQQLLDAQKAVHERESRRPFPTETTRLTPQVSEFAGGIESVPLGDVATLGARYGETQALGKSAQAKETANRLMWDNMAKYVQAKGFDSFADATPPVQLEAMEFAQRNAGMNVQDIQVGAETGARLGRGTRAGEALKVAQTRKTEQEIIAIIEEVKTAVERRPLEYEQLKANIIKTKAQAAAAANIITHRAQQIAIAKRKLNGVGGQGSEAALKRWAAYAKTIETERNDLMAKVASLQASEGYLEMLDDERVRMEAPLVREMAQLKKALQDLPAGIGSYGY